jgi:4-amino-4-deoxy-L-arabinose transferase-like glycosyltransferase
VGLAVGAAADRGRQDGLARLTYAWGAALPAPAGQTIAERQPRPREWLLVFAVSLACLLFGLATLRPENLAAYDQPLYLGIASDLLQTGTYTNGRWGPPGQPGAYTAPLYPAFLAAIGAIDPRLAKAAACVRVADWAAIPSCPGGLGLLIPVQLLLFAATLALIWRTVLAIGGGRWQAWCALLAAGLGTTEYAVYARTAMTEALSLPLSAASGLLLILLLKRPRPLTAVALGVSLGLLTLARPEYLYLTAAMGIAGLALAPWRRRFGLFLAAACVIAGLTIAPWSVRNERLFGTPAPTFGYAGFILGQRVVYDEMTPAEWTAQWIYALPGFGPAAARLLFPGAVARLGWQERPDTFYMVGNTAMVHELAANAPNPADQVPYLLHHYIGPHPLRFLAVTLVMAWKALWVRKYFSLVTVPFFAVMTWRALRHGDAVRLAFVLPPLFILALHAATTVATPRYSLNLVPCYAAAFGLAAGAFLQRRWAAR